MITIADLVVQKLPARAGVATQVLCVADDPDSSAGDLARAVGADPALASRTLALANSAYYGLSGRVATMEFAVSVIGFNTVRALALTLAAGLDRPGAVPDGFWEQAATSAAAASVLAPTFGASAPEAFCLGLLHTIGSALLHQVLPLPGLCLPFPADPAQLAEREHDRYGYGHAAVGAEVLAQWNFPTTMCDLIAKHHDELTPDAPPLARALEASRRCTDIVLRGAHGAAPEADPALMALATTTLLEQIREKAAPLQSSLTSV